MVEVASLLYLTEKTCQLQLQSIDCCSRWWTVQDAIMIPCPLVSQVALHIFLITEESTGTLVELFTKICRILAFSSSFIQHEDKR